MSSLAAARADNFYFPPEWTPEMGGISKFQGSKGKNQYEQYGIIRFELPFDGWCLGCGIHMTKGLRFNAKKEKEGKYFTTQIWAFHMKCFSCEQKFKILTDPKNCTYDMAEGIRKHEQDFTPDADDSLIVATSDEARQLIATDPMYRLQHGEEDRQRVLTAKERMDALIEVQEAHHKDYYDANSILRDKNRKRKKRDIELQKEGTARGLSMPLLETSQQDADAAKEVVFTARRIANSFAVTETHRLSNIQAQSIFDRPTTRPAASSSSSTNAHKVSSREKQHLTKTGSAETRMVVHSSSHHRSDRNDAVKPRPVLDGAGKYSETARLLAKANARQIDPKDLRLAARPVSAAASTVPTSGIAKATNVSTVPKITKVTAIKPSGTGSVPAPVDSGGRGSNALDLLADYS
jgi:coiled-coil domain-containing protein 130